MSGTIVTSVSHYLRLERARAWLESRGQSEDLLVVGATLDGANELARGIAMDKVVTFGWNRLGISQLAFAIASPALAARRLVPLSHMGTEAIVARIVHRMKADAALKQYRVAAAAPWISAGSHQSYLGVACGARTSRRSEGDRAGPRCAPRCV